MKKYRISTQARNDIARIYQYGIRTHSQYRAVEYRHNILQRLDEIAETPSQYPLADNVSEGYRRSIYDVNTIYYRIVDGTVQIVRVLGRQDFRPRRD